MNATHSGLVAAAALILLLLAAMALPSFTGPVLECGELEPAVCDQAWREVSSEMGDWGPVAFLPVTRVVVFDATNHEPMCGTFTIERFWVFARSVTYDCA